MKKEFESEIRIMIQDIDEFLNKLEVLKAKIIQSYRFTDYIYIPKKPSSNWNPKYKIMRIRQYFSPNKQSYILFTENEFINGKIFQFKRSLYPQGKIELFQGDQPTAEALLLSWDFQPYFKIEKTDGKLYEITHPIKFIIAVEEINEFGYSAEIELWGDNLTHIEDLFLNILSELETPLEAITSNPLPYIIAKHLGLVFND